MTSKNAATQGAQFSIRRMTKHDLDRAVEWARTEGWNPGRDDAECFFRADPQGFFVGELDGQPIAAISMVTYGGTFAFGGFYIVVPEYRHKRYGIQLFEEAMKYAGNRNVGGDGVVEQQENYRKVGFKLAYRNIRFEGHGGGTMYADVTPLSRVPFEMVLDYDTRHFPAARETFLRCWLTQPGHTALGIVKEGQMKGYGVVRPCAAGYKVGPLFADSRSEAEKLYHSLAAFATSGPVYLDVPEVNTAAVELAHAHNMRQVFETARMYNKETPNLPMHEIFGVTSFELG